MSALPAFAAYLFGSIYGSFLNVVVHRLPREQSLAHPGSRCPRCGRAIAWHDNVPVLSWLLLRGRGRCCGKPIAARYPLVEAATGLLAAGLWTRWDARPGFAVGTALACGVLLALALIDWDSFIIPDELSLALGLSGFLFSPLNPYFDPGPFGDWWRPLWWSARGAGLGFALGWALMAGGEAIFRKDALGGGDVKLLAAVGAWAGFTGAFDCLMIGSLLGSVHGLRLMALGRIKRQDPIPFGPFLAAGAAFNFFRLLPIGWPLL